MYRPRLPATRTTKAFSKNDAGEPVLKDHYETAFTYDEDGRRPVAKSTTVLEGGQTVVWNANEVYEY